MMMMMITRESFTDEWHVCRVCFAACSYDSSLSLTSHGSVSGPAAAVSNLLSATDTLARAAGPTTAAAAAEYNGLDFRITMDTRSGPPVTITLVASTLHEKAAWCSDISQVSHSQPALSPAASLAALLPY